MNKNSNSVVSSLVIEETAKKVSGKVSANVDSVSNTSLSLDNEENESPKKKEVFNEVRVLFGFVSEDINTIADEIQENDNSLKFSEIKKLASLEVKKRKALNAKIENLSFASICDTISKSDLFGDFSKFVSSDLVSLESRLFDGGKVKHYHSSATNEKNEPYLSEKVTVKGLHKPFTTFAYYDLHDVSTSNIIGAFQRFTYFKVALNKVNKMKSKETLVVAKYLELKKQLHDEFGYMPNDFENL